MSILIYSIACKFKNLNQSKINFRISPQFIGPEKARMKVDTEPL